jgi:hypothetical protein
MAVQGKYTFTRDNVKHVIDEAYLRIIKIVTEINDVEIFENAPENDENIDQILTYDKRMENRAIVYVYADKYARAAHAFPVDSFTFNFKYDLDNKDNIYAQAYNKLEILDHRLENIIRV